MGDVSLPQEEHYYRVQAKRPNVSTPVYYNRLDRAEMEKIVNDPSVEVTKVESITVKPVVLDMTYRFVEPPKDTWGVHETHCCKDHGCKYGQNKCPVKTGKVRQQYPCEFCDYDAEGYPEYDPDEHAAKSGDWGPIYG